MQEALRRFDNANANGLVVDVHNEDAVVTALQSLAPIDHVVFSAVDNIIRGKLEDLDLDDAKQLFGVKFWGAVIVGKGNSMNLEGRIPLTWQHWQSTTLYGEVVL